jgi:hypothetical protein
MYSGEAFEGRLAIFTMLSRVFGFRILNSELLRALEFTLRDPAFCGMLNLL